MSNFNFQTNQTYGNLSGADFNWFATHHHYSNTASWLIYQNSAQELQTPPKTIGNAKGDQISFKAAVLANETQFNNQTMVILSNPASQKTLDSDADFEAFHHASTTDRRLRYFDKQLQPNQFKINFAGAFVTDMITTRWDSNPENANVWKNISRQMIVDQLLLTATDLLTHNQCQHQALDLVLAIHKSSRSDKIAALLVDQLQQIKTGGRTVAPLFDQTVQAGQVRLFRLPCHPGIQGKGAQRTIDDVRKEIKRLF